MSERKRTIVLELLRHGASGQLLSPSTPYLALCGDNPVQSFQVPLEHVDYLSRLEGLTYRQRDPIVTGAALREATRDVSRIFAQIDALAGELRSAAETAEVVHLRLVLSAAELSALPFELAEAPPGSPNAGRSLLLDGNRRVVLTREARRVPPPPARWPHRPRILFAFASPRRPLPVEAHMLALRRALDPWIGWGDDPIREIERHLTVLPNASIGSIERACSRAAGEELGPYTHVHILAHGVVRPVPGSREVRHYVALHKSDGSAGIDPVDGQVLEKALRPVQAARDTLAVVTVASCDSANFGSIIASRANIAHELHEAGIPFVAASQFPLSLRGSVILADRLYRQLLQGVDPILATHDVRSALQVLASRENHDWASLSVYAALPPDIDAQVLRARFHRLRKAGDVALARSVRQLDVEAQQKKDAAQLAGAQASPTTAPVKGAPRAANAHERALDNAVRAMEGFARAEPRFAAQAQAWIASVAARWAQALHEAGLVQAAAAPTPEGGATTSLVELSLEEVLRAAERASRETFRLDPGVAWPLVQAINMRWTRTGEIDSDAWTTAVWLSSQGICSPDMDRRRSAHDDLAQLHLLSPALPRLQQSPTPTEAPSLAMFRSGAPGVPGNLGTEAEKHVAAVLEIAGARSWTAFTLRRQMKRRSTWWSGDTPPAGAQAVIDVAKRIEADLARRGVPDQWNER